jgi:PKHD-type hydroxylase
MYQLRLNEKTFPVYWNNDFLSDDEIKLIIEYSKNIEQKPGKVGNPHQKDLKKSFSIDYRTKNENSRSISKIRNSFIKWIKLNEDTKWLYHKIIKEIHKVNQENYDYILKYIEDLQFSEYDKNYQGFYSKHTDCSDNESIENDFSIRKLSFSIQLSDPKDYEGGELVIYKDSQKLIAPKEKGTIIFFLSNIVHEVKPVTKGTRYSLVSWVRGPNLK